MKRDAPPDPQLRCATPPQADEAPTPLDGTWEMSASRARAGAVDAGDYRMVLRRGRVFDLVHESGFERLARERLLQSPRGEDLVPVRRRQLCRLHVERVS